VVQLIRLPVQRHWGQTTRTLNFCLRLTTGRTASAIWSHEDPLVVLDVSLTVLYSRPERIA